jgi:prepilin-type processing-associated H-X9-DG protein
MVVIVIVGILASVVLPVLANAKRSARRLECLTRMKQWGQGFVEYTHDNDDWTPREGFHSGGQTAGNNWVQVQHVNSQDVWYNALSNDVGCLPASSYSRPTNNAGFYEHQSFFHCPSAPFRGGSAQMLAPRFSMAMNSNLIDPPLDDPAVAKIKFTRIRQPSLTPLFLDNLLEGEKPVSEAQDRTHLGQPAANARRFAGVRHDGMGNLAFADGHAASVAGKKVVQTDGLSAGFAISPAVDVFWDP